MTDDRLREAALTQAISVIENYGKHHAWCDRSDGAAEPCNCGLWPEIERLKDLAQLAPDPRPAAPLDEDATGGGSPLDGSSATVPAPSQLAPSVTLAVSESAGEP